MSICTIVRRIAVGAVGLTALVLVGCGSGNNSKTEDPTPDETEDVTDDNNLCKTTYSDDKLIETTKCYREGEDTPYETVITNNRNPKYTETTTIRGPSKKITTVYKNENGQLTGDKYQEYINDLLTLERERTADGRVKQKKEFEYDDQGRVEKETIYEWNKLIETTDFTYVDGKKKESFRIEYSSGGGCEIERTYTNGSTEPETSVDCGR